MTLGAFVILTAFVISSDFVILSAGRNLVLGGLRSLFAIKMTG